MHRTFSWAIDFGRAALPTAVQASALVAFVLVTLGIGADRRAEAANVVYNLVSYPALQNGYTLTGTITTNGHIGILAYSDILDASFAVSNGVNSYQTIHSSEVYGITSLLATATELLLPASTDTHSFPHLKIGGAGFETPQLQLDYLKFGDGSIALYADCDVDHPTTLTTVWNTTSGAALLQLDGSPLLIATVVPEPSTLILTATGAGFLLGVRRGKRRSKIRHLHI